MIHSKWSGGDLIFYDSTQEIFRIKDDTGGIVVGTTGAEIPIKLYGDITYPIPTTATSSSGSNITLTSASNRSQFLASTGAFNLIVPTSSGTGVGGIEFKIFNSTAGDCSVYETSSGGALVATIGAGEGGIVASNATEWRAITGST